MANSIALAREQEIFAVAETTRGTLVFPAATDFIIGAGFAEIGQQPSFSKSKEVVNSRDVLARIMDRFKAGEWEIPIYARPSGALGTAPMAAILFKCLMGVQTINAGVSVVYSQAKEKPSFSLWIRKDHAVFFARGCTVSKVAAELQTEGNVELTFSGGFMEMGWVGTDDMTATEPLAEDDIAVTDAKKFIAGGKVQFRLAAGTIYDNSDAGYTVASVNYTTNVVTITPALEAEVASGSFIEPFLPVGSTTSYPISAAACKAQVGGADKGVTVYSYEITDPVAYLDREITSTGFPEGYVEGQRDITGELGFLFRRDDLHYFYDGRNDSKLNLKMVCGTVAGKIMEINTPYSSVNIPKPEEVDETIETKLDFLAVGSAGEDSATITFK